MARYIRTKDGVYDGEKYNADYILDYELGKILKQSENLEELCDEFVVDSKVNNAHCMYDWFDLCEELQEGRFHSTDEVYGAIWTSKGLIYVAKMDNKGKLELI